ncbi:RagB/SusD family nutrient uptake outer membrane protein [Tamlana sp. 2201CG12-4]|uniref:RagB/SusD family nutrient uptake outer membrane protein n=1 Tax=Tamlana sp. 2201CG12-4 TaxID=3112582 RepID=UPI002DB9F93D|nr:RagB/SusD family nutrient uptake outer membrane protein [Tamlana sp. 2201CG12-4]MEC3907630.1 RagB/SusD family nutrient uptake outer membrane protein [Tamlana sp. 2201CG12-4]
MKNIKNKLKFRLKLVALLSVFFITSCEKELDLQPLSSQTSDITFQNEDAYKQFLAKIYGGFSLTGQDTSGSFDDIAGIDGNFSNYLRLLFTIQELSTDEAIIAWNDQTIHDIHNHVWTSGDAFITATYARIYFQVGLINQFLRETEESVLDSRGVGAELKKDISGFRDEARFLRAFSYWHGLDMFGDLALVDENDIVGAFFPEQTSKEEVFDYLESELLDIESRLPNPRQNEYGRADKGYVWMLLAKLYLNAEVYTGAERYADAFEYTSKVINGGYTLVPNYNYLFLADNDRNGAENEIIYPFLFDGLANGSFGGTTYLVHAAIGGDMDPSVFGVNGGWGGLRTTSVFVDKWSDITGATDSRAMMHTSGQTLEIDNPFDFTQGYAITKYRNVDVNGNIGSDPSGNNVDVNFPVFRLADAYLMYAEIVLRGGGGDMDTAVGYINELRERAYGNSSGNVSIADLDLEFILDERSRELYWENHRRTDLIRFNQFSENGIWPWKGNIAAGKTTESYRDLYPVPSAELNANPNLIQNEGY